MQLRLNGFASADEIIWMHPDHRRIKDDLRAANTWQRQMACLTAYRDVAEDLMASMISVRDPHRVAPCGNAKGCCVKLHRNHLLHHIRLHCGWSMNKDLEIIQAICPEHTKFIRLTRRDRVAQAVSHLFANGTNQWHSYDAPSGKPEDVCFTTYDADYMLAWSCSSLYNWYDLDSSLEILDVTYESLPEDMHRISEFLGCRLKWVDQQVLAKQTDRRKEEFLGGYRLSLLGRIDIEALRVYVPFRNLESGLTERHELMRLACTAVRTEDYQNKRGGPATARTHPILSAD